MFSIRLYMNQENGPERLFTMNLDELPEVGNEITFQGITGHVVSVVLDQGETYDVICRVAPEVDPNLIWEGEDYNGRTISLRKTQYSDVFRFSIRGQGFEDSGIEINSVYLEELKLALTEQGIVSA